MKPEVYAQALVEMVQGGKTPHEAVRALAASLERTHKAGMLRRLLPHLDRMRIKKMHGATLTVANESDAKDALHKAGVSAHDVRTVVDESIIGGWKLQKGSTIKDATYKTALLTMYRNVIR